MNFKMIGRFMAQIILIEGVFLLPALGISLFCDEPGAVRGFLYTLAIMLLLGGGLFLFCRKAGKLFGAREGLVCVGFSWIVMSLLGCLPFWISGEIPKFVDAFFEIVSGFTTTGASILNDVEALSHACLFWRSFSHWIGGMGVFVFLLIVLPLTGGSNMHLMRAESPGPSVGKLVPKVRETAKILYLIYIVMTIVEIVILLCGKMPLFDAITLAPCISCSSLFLTFFFFSRKVWQ